MINVIRQSSLSRWLKCGQQFYYIEIEGLRMPPGVAARRGSAGHKACEINHKQKIKTQVDLPLSDLQDAGRDEFVRLVKDEGVFIPKDKVSGKKTLLNDTLNDTLGAIAVYRDKFAPTINPVMVEKTIAGDVGFKYPISGTLDITSKIEKENEEEIIDFKIMKRKSQFWADRQIQATMYCLLYHLETGHWPEQFKYNIVVPNKTPVSQTIITTRLQPDLNTLHHYVEQFLKDLSEESFRPADPDHWICTPEYCGFWPICKFANKG